MIVIVDYGMGNAASILNMIRKVNREAVISSDCSIISDASALILPGVGSFDHAIDRLRNSGIDEIIKRRILIDKVPFLGICLGMQLLFDSSEEGNKPGLGLVSGTVKRFDFSEININSLKIPHMGWNVVTPTIVDKLFYGLERQSRFYFVHSYYVVCNDPENEIAKSSYGFQFTCAIKKDNIYAVQFHPEKSHKFGLQMFKNFLEFAC